MYIQIIAVLLAVYLVSRTALQYKKGALTLLESIAWSLVWIGAAVAIVFPKTIDHIASSIGLQSTTGIDLVAYSGIAVLFYLLYRMFVRIEKLDRDITQVVRTDALSHVRKKEGNE